MPNKIKKINQDKKESKMKIGKKKLVRQITFLSSQWPLKTRNLATQHLYKCLLKVSSVHWMKCFVFSVKLMLKSNNLKMHGLSEIGPNVPAFLVKLWKLVNSPETDSLICWSESGLSFIILNHAQFSRELLSLYYKHNNMASFIRQLNMYGFHKIVSDGGSLKSDNIRSAYKDCMEFAHQYFIKDHPYLLENIKRKPPNPKSGVILNEQLNNASLKNGTQSEILSKVLSDINNLKGKQESWDARLASMKRENEALWRELAIFRQKHLKQEQIINRLIHFIVTIVQPSRNVPLRRRYPLMLNDIHPVKKITKFSGADTTNLNEGSPTGPTIHEIDSTDVIFGSPEQPEVSTTNTEFISSDLPKASPKFVEVESSEATSTEKEDKIKPSVETAENIPEEWLEIQLTEADMIDPLTPIDPAKVNPAVAAATMKHLEGTNKIVSPIAITIPSVTSSEPGKKNKVTEKKVIYLTNINDLDKSKKNKKPIVLKLDNVIKKSNSGSSDSLLLPVAKKTDNSAPVTKQTGTAVKRKLSNPKQGTATTKKDKVPKRAAKKADSKICVPEVEIDDDLDFLLSAKKLEDDIAELRESEKVNETSSDQTTVDSFLKLEDLYNGTVSDDQLITSSENATELEVRKADSVHSSEDDKLPSPSLADAKELVSEEETKTSDVLNFEPDSMAVVCQPPGNVETLTRELSSHVDSMQGEIDYLKEMLKGEGYNFDTNSLPWLFNDDLLSYGVMPSADDEGNEKKGEEAEISGNELMSYGTPNLMDLVDVIGSSGSNQDWNLSPTSPLVTDLATPAPSPSKFSFPSPGKRRKI